MGQKYNCEVVRDLLPLYQDEVCSEESRKLVKEHLTECESCKEIVEKLSRNEVENILEGERGGVLYRHEKKEKCRTATIGMVTAGVLMIPILVCLICNLAVGHALDWFFIVLASLMVFASLTVVPLVMEKNRVFWTLGSFLVTLLLLLGVINIYTGGTWFMIAAVPVLFGMNVIFLPYILYKCRLPFCLQNKKGLLAMLADTAFLYVLIWVCGFYSNSPLYNKVAYAITTVSCVFVWAVFLTVRYLKTTGLMKTGLVLMEIGIFGPFIDCFVDFCLEGDVLRSLKSANLFSWTFTSVDANINLLLFAVFVFTGLILLIAGGIKKHKG